MPRFSDHTTARVGGSAGEWIVAETESRAIEVLRQHPLPTPEQRAAGADTLLVLGGGSNLLVSDAGFPGTVLQLAFGGITEEPADEASGDVVVTVAAGHGWDQVVAWSVERRYAGLEALSGIPGAAGATPVQNVGAYGADVSQTLVDVRVWDRAAGRIVVFSADDLDFGYRDSVLKRTTINGSPHYVVLSVRFRLEHRGESTPSSPVRYAELARSLGLDIDAALDQRRAPLQDVRDKVLALRAGKGMVLDAEDHDTWSTGSFFTNPILPAENLPELPEGAPRFAAGTDSDGTPLVKLSAAWLIDRSGCAKGFGAELTGGRASLSTKHTLALTNRGEATTEDLLTVARAVRDAVVDRFGVELHPEPVLIGTSL
ncbi:UDP-N-acetylmuramate dehydrogenase [Nesterenkonia aerolata]|uniref:UDP-N-acetylenolpyruvoylglucosamine reductase n=1 Tax=Nesterenkonia aerolata TaxID=3074079 RepID=A0ABU2DTE8_9MICC|nr:UDP-N-acetylmuramate dehydrogenase [Nesterenkonia sp. LY-0111]MDR8019773.1 UDP-N-acetylmuramate dehydrogenase [Nesterenkonia sp. LY-0111]